MQRNFWDGVRVTPQLMRWKNKLFDVCGIGQKNPTQKLQREIFITHTHRDHLPLRLLVAPGTKIHVAPPLLPRVQKIYPQAVVEEHLDYFTTEHTLIANGRITRAESYGYFIKDLVVIPESDHATQLVKEYKSKVTFVFAFKQPRNHLGGHFNNHRRDVFILDNTTWRRYRPNIIPKIVFAESDRETYQRWIVPRRKFFTATP